MQHRLDRTPQASRLRRQTVEHPFGTLKGMRGLLDAAKAREPRCGEVGAFWATPS